MAPGRAEGEWCFVFWRWSENGRGEYSYKCAAAAEFGAKDVNFVTALSVKMLGVWHIYCSTLFI